jgi:hypothetical protein
MKYVVKLKKSSWASVIIEAEDISEVREMAGDIGHTLNYSETFPIIENIEEYRPLW